MKKAIAIALAFVLIMGCVTLYAQQAQTEQSHVQRIGEALKKFFTDLGNLITKKIPETPQQKSSRQPWEPRSSE
jgi:hypothetical protein